MKYHVLKILRKLKYFILFLSCFCFCMNVNAEVFIYQTDLSYAIYTANNDVNYTVNPTDLTNSAGTTFIGFTASNTATRQIYYFNNIPVDEYDVLDFNIYVGNLPYVSSATNCSPNSSCYEASFDNVPPLVIFGGNMCSVVSLGRTNYYGNTGYNYQYIYHAQCKTYNSTANNVQILYLPPSPSSSSNVYYGISRPIIMSKSGDSTLKEIDESVKEFNKNITSTDTTQSQSQADSFFDDFQSSDYGLSDIVTMPLTLINSLTNASCVSLQLQVPFVNQTIELPCMSTIYQQYFGNAYNLYKIITFGFTAYWVCVRILALVKDFKNPEHDEIEVLDL